MKYISLTLFLLVSIRGLSQPQLVLIKKNKAIARFSEGDQIRLRQKGQQTFTSGTITGIHRNFIKLNDTDTIPLYKIQTIDMRAIANTGLKTSDMGSKLIIAGGLLLLADEINQRGYDSGRGVVIASGIFITVGLFLKLVNNNYYQVSRIKHVTVLGS